MTPWGLRRLLNWIKDHYANPPLYITANGYSDTSATLDDQDRIDYFRSYINEVLKGEQFIKKHVDHSLDDLNPS